jgi:hypothetical protein
VKRGKPLKRTPLARKTPLRAKPPESGEPQKAKTRVRAVNPKRKAQRFARDFGDHADFIRSLPCVVGAGCTGGIEAHHEPPRGSGGRRSDLVPVCTGHHRERHSKGRPAFELRYGLDLKATAARLWGVSPHNDDSMGRAA